MNKLSTLKVNETHVIKVWDYRTRLEVYKLDKKINRRFRTVSKPNGTLLVVRTA